MREFESSLPAREYLPERTCDTLLNHQFPFGQKRRCPFSLQKANVGVSGHPSRWVGTVPRNVLIKVVVIPVFTFGQSCDEEPTYIQLAVVPHTTSPLARPDFQQRQIRAGGDRAVVVVVSRVVTKRRNCFGKNGVWQLRQWVQRRQVVSL